MNQLLISEKYALMALNEQKKMNYFLSYHNGVYVSGMLDLVNNQMITNTEEVYIEVLDDALGLEAFISFVKKHEGVSIVKIMKKLMSPFGLKVQKQMKNDVLTSLEKKLNGFDYEAVKKEIVQDIKVNMNRENLVLVKLLIEFKLMKRYFTKEEVKLMKERVENLGEDAVLKDLFKVIRSLQAVGALAGSGAF